MGILLDATEESMKHFSTLKAPPAKPQVGTRDCPLFLFLRSSPSYINKPRFTHCIYSMTIVVDLDRDVLS